MVFSLLLQEKLRVNYQIYTHIFVAVSVLVCTRGVCVRERERVPLHSPGWP